jgi:hypothetical protein
MTLPVWDTNVPSRARDGWQMTEPNLAPLASEMDGGNVRLRRRPGDNVAKIMYPLIPLTDAQFALFRTFYRTTISGGVSRFTMSLMTDNAVETKTVQFEKPPAFSKEGAYWMVTLPLRVYGV